MSVNAHKTDPRITKETIFESMSSEDSDSDSLASIGKYDSFYDNWFYLFLKQFLQLKGIFLFILTVEKNAPNPTLHSKV